ncbi:MAG: porin [Lysobacterales bacterium]
MRLINKPGTTIATIATVFLLCTQGVQAQVSNAELLEKLESMQQQIDELRRQLAQTEEKTSETDAKVEAVAEVIESSPPAATRASKTQIGGYGELHYNNLDADDPSRDVDMIDFHRFVLFFGHEFNERTRFYSEVEVEHAFVADSGGDTPGEVEIEQAFVEFDLRQDLYARAGLFLIPVGIINETHEPATFYGVERNDVENIVIPSTWWEGGAGLNGRWGSGWNWDLAFTSGLAIPTSGINAFRVRSGRQKVAEANASDGAITGRLRYLGIPGLLAAVTVQYQFDPSQVSNDGLDSGTLVEAHIDYQRNGFGLRALYARWDFTGAAVEAAGAETQTGWYVEPSYRLNDSIGFYTRYENVDAPARGADQFNQWELGLNWWLASNVVVKFDYRSRSHDLDSESGRDFTGFDLGLGYNF